LVARVPPQHAMRTATAAIEHSRHRRILMTGCYEDFNRRASHSPARLNASRLLRDCVTWVHGPTKVQRLGSRNCMAASNCQLEPERT
jgi:hypothetical protein